MTHSLSGTTLLRHGDNSSLVSRSPRKLVQRISFQNSSSSPGNQSVTFSSGSGTNYEIWNWKISVIWSSMVSSIFRQSKIPYFVFLRRELSNICLCLPESKAGWSKIWCDCFVKEMTFWWNFNFSLNSNQTTHPKIHWRSYYWKSGSRNVWRSWEAMQHHLHSQQLRQTHLHHHWQQHLHPPANVLRFMQRMWLQQLCANCGTNCKGWRPAATTTTTVVVSGHLLSWCCAPTGATPPAPLCCASCGVKYKHSVTR